MSQRAAHEPELTEGEAVNTFERALGENPDAKAHFNLGSAYYIAHDLNDARREFEKAVSLNPGIDHAHYYLGVIYRAQGEAEQARREFETVLNSNAHMMLKNQATIQLKSMGK